MIVTAVLAAVNVIFLSMATPHPFILSTVATPPIFYLPQIPLRLILVNQLLLFNLSLSLSGTIIATSTHQCISGYVSRSGSTT
ncbi:hypothetical protein DFH94DRAFT_703449 [Russula ochroleuca]|uniref:Uncharacterized protein n=1 Tax=Russula ochroleuca TaxID=152965 RepID=A0A9P5N653_9AGAM|nr:hypothetical protein DFH94DRAFT_703449 [Russula ochroleuca]